MGRGGPGKKFVCCLKCREPTVQLRRLRRKKGSRRGPENKKSAERLVVKLFFWVTGGEYGDFSHKRATGKPPGKRTMLFGKKHKTRPLLGECRSQKDGRRFRSWDS